MKKRKRRTISFSTFSPCVFKHLPAKRCSHAKIKSDYSPPCGQTASSKRSTKDAIKSTRKVFPTLCSNSRFTVCFSSSTAIKGENSAQCSLTWKKWKWKAILFLETDFQRFLKHPHRFCFCRHFWLPHQTKSILDLHALIFRWLTLPTPLCQISDTFAQNWR